MDWLFIPGMDDENEDQNEVKNMDDLIDAFVTAHPDLQQHIKEFDDTAAITAKADAVYTIIRDFIASLKEQPDRHEGISYNPTNAD